MKIIGITGKSGSGKSTFASLLAQKLECQHIDIDKVGHQALFQPDILATLCDKFGTEILDKDGNIDRKKMGDIVFTQRHKMNILSDLTWNYMQQTLDNILLQKNGMIVLEWILLPHSKYWNNCNSKILVTSNDIMRKDKVLQRDNISEEYFAKRDSASIDYYPYKFDYIFENDYQPQTMNRMIEKIRKQFIDFDDYGGDER